MNDQSIKYRTTVWAGELQRLRAMERELYRLREFLLARDHDIVNRSFVVSELDAVLRVHE